MPDIDPDKIDTPEEMADFEDFSKRWEAINEEGERRLWLHWTGYESGPELWSPNERESQRRSDINQRKRMAEEAERERKRHARDARFEREQAALKKRIYG